MTSQEREGKYVRETRETKVEVYVKLSPGDVSIETPIPFLNHILETLIVYANISGYVKAVNKRRFDDHHIVEDVALTLGEALDKALSNRVGIARFGWSIIPMDDALALVSIDLGSRPYTYFKAKFKREVIDGLYLENIKHFINSLSNSLKSTIHAIVIHGENDHHKVEALFKALGISLKQAIRIISKEILSTKGTITTD